MSSVGTASHIKLIGRSMNKASYKHLTRCYSTCRYEPLWVSYFQILPGSRSWHKCHISTRLPNRSSEQHAGLANSFIRTSSFEEPHSNNFIQATSYEQLHRNNFIREQAIWISRTSHLNELFEHVSLPPNAYKCIQILRHSNAPLRMQDHCDSSSLAFETIRKSLD